MGESFQQRWSAPVLYVLDILRRIEAGEQFGEESVRRRLLNLLSQFDVRGEEAEAFRLAKAAIVFWIDELLIRSAWDSALAWRNQPLEMDVYGTRDRAWMFYYYAEFARGLDTPAALEVFAVCAALGFQGVYRENVLNRVHELANAVETTEESRRVLLSAAAAASADGARLPRSADVLNGLPREFQRWLAGVFVQLNGDTVHAYQPKSPPDSARDARPLTAASALTRWSALLTAGILICLILHSLDGFGVI